MENELSAVRKLVRVKSYKNASKMMWVAELGTFFIFSISLYLLFYSQEYLNVLYSFFVKGIFIFYFVLSQTQCQRTTVFK